MKLGERLRMWRLAAGLSTTQAGRAARLNQSYISQLENGRHTPSGTALLSLAGAYGCEVAQLLTGEPELRAATAAAILQRVDQQAAENQRRELAEALQAARAAENAAALARAEFEAELARLREHLAQLEANTEHGFRCLESRLDTSAYEGEPDLGGWDEPGGVALETRIRGMLAAGPLYWADLLQRLGCADFELEAALANMAGELANGYTSDGLIMLEDVPDDVTSLRNVRNDAPAIWREKVRKALAARKRGTAAGDRYWNQAYGGARA